METLIVLQVSGKKYFFRIFTTLWMGSKSAGGSGPDGF